MTGREISIHRLSDASSRGYLQRTLQHLGHDQFHDNAITILCRLRNAHISEHSYLLTAGITDTDTAQWLAAFVDRSRRPETELYLAGSWETANEYDEASVQDVLRRLMFEVQRLGVPPSTHAKDDGSGDSSVLLCGAVHERTYTLLKAANMISADSAGSEIGYRTFLFDIKALSSPSALPDGLHWDKLRSEHYEVIRSTSTIPRQEATLAMLPSVAVFSRTDRDPVAWGFVGLDGSLSTLYVMPSHRGQGLGSLLCSKLLKDKMDGFFGPDDKRVGHSFVAPDNLASTRTSQRAGGIDAGHAVYWVRVSLSEIAR